MMISLFHMFVCFISLYSQCAEYTSVDNDDKFVCFISLYSQCAEYTSVDNDDKFVSYVCLFYKFILPVCGVHEC